ncbi:MAG: recombination mediator RecR [Bacteroidia bacterium]|nr:recombination mediator RecR [Bacteroidia bacterium]MDW8135106.1 recombination mediator RecR [Bacteroidia bacterium]
MQSVLPPILNTLQHALEKLPGIGPRSALRIVQALLKRPEWLKEILKTLQEVELSIYPCPQCGFWAEKPQALCTICANPARDVPILCIVKDPVDVLAIEKSQAFQGHYHVLGGVLDPLAGVQEKDLRLRELWQRLRTRSYEEVLIALGTSPEAETTAYYIARQLADWPGKVTRFVSGIPVGSELEYIDPLTLSRSIRERQPISL